MEEDCNMALELIYLASNRKKKVCVKKTSFILEKI
jgi:hypothetical protein